MSNIHSLFRIKHGIEFEGCNCRNRFDSKIMYLMEKFATGNYQLVNVSSMELYKLFVDAPYLILINAHFLNTGKILKFLIFPSLFILKTYKTQITHNLVVRQ